MNLDYGPHLDQYRVAEYVCLAVKQPPQILIYGILAKKITYITVVGN